MVGHLVVPSLDKSNFLTHSYKITTDLLKKDLGFEEKS